MQIMISVETVVRFFTYFGAALVAEALFLVLYMAVTTHHELALIKQGNAAAGISTGGAVLGFTLPLAAVITKSVSLADMAVWSSVALGVQLGVYLIIDLLLRDISSKIAKGNVAAGVTLGAASLALGVLNAASISG